jgi:hypothetical protein
MKSDLCIYCESVELFLCEGGLLLNQIYGISVCSNLCVIVIPL